MLLIRRRMCRRNNSLEVLKIGKFHLNCRTGMGNTGKSRERCSFRHVSLGLQIFANCTVSPRKQPNRCISRQYGRGTNKKTMKKGRWRWCRNHSTYDHHTKKTGGHIVSRETKAPVYQQSERQQRIKSNCSYHVGKKREKSEGLV